MFRSIRLVLSLWCGALGCAAQTAVAPAPALRPLSFLLGTWSAKTISDGTAAATALGSYTFALDLHSFAMQRTASTAQCTGPKSFDCSHTDQLTIYPEGGGVRALYLDNEGHVIHYLVSTPDATTVQFLSEGPQEGPHFRLLYHLESSGPNAALTGSFEGAAPGSTNFHPYLRWTGTRQ